MGGAGGLEGDVREKGDLACSCGGIIEPGVPLQLQLPLFVFRRVEERLGIVDGVEIHLGVIAQLQGEGCVVEGVEGNGFCQNRQAVRVFGGFGGVEDKMGGGRGNEKVGRGAGDCCEEGVVAGAKVKGDRRGGGRWRIAALR